MNIHCTLASILGKCSCSLTDTKDQGSAKYGADQMQSIACFYKALLQHRQNTLINLCIF